MEPYVTLILRSSLIKRCIPGHISKSLLSGKSFERYSHGTSLKPRNLSNDNAKQVTKKRNMLCSVLLENTHQIKADG